MNTPAHAVVNLLLLSQRPSHRKTAAIVSGALIPDLVIILFYAWHSLLGTAENQIWSVEYYRPHWQTWIDSFNSIPLIVLAMLLCWKTGRNWWLVLLASMLLHAIGDLPLHHHDAHRHFFPLLDWRFASPVSYWDPAFHGNWAGLIEAVCVLAASIYLYFRHPVLRIWVLVCAAVYLIYWIYVFNVWM